MSSRGPFKPILVLLLWLTGLGALIYCAPTGYRTLPLAADEQVAAFLGQSHQLVIAGGRASKGPRTPKRTANGLRPSRYIGTRSFASYNRISLLNVDDGSARSIPLDGLGPIYGVTPCTSGERLCIECFFREKPPLEDHFGLAVFSISDRKVIRKATWIGRGSWPYWSVSADGSKLAYVDQGAGQAKLVCLDVDTGRELYRADNTYGFLSSTGTFLAVINAQTGWDVVDLEHRGAGHRFKNGPAADVSMAAFSPRGHRFIDTSGIVWDVASNREIGRIGGHAIFADGGNAVVWVDEHANDCDLKWLYIKGNRKLAERRVPMIIPRPEPIDQDACLIHVAGSHSETRPSLVQRVLDWIGFKRAASVSPPHLWLLADGRTGEVLARNTDYLQAVSSDGRYLVSAEEDGSHAKLYELPLRPSLMFLATTGGIWTMLVVVVWDRVCPRKRRARGGLLLVARNWRHARTAKMGPEP
jgi:hypothetical protein